MPSAVADLFAAFELFIEFACFVGAVNPAQRQSLTDTAWAALNESARAQHAHQKTSEPYQMFFNLIVAALVMGRAHIATLHGDKPIDSRSWGWRLAGRGEQGSIEPQGACIGWIADDNETLYLEADASYTIAQEIGGRQGNPLPVSQTMLARNLRDNRLLVTTDENRETLTIRKMVDGKSYNVLHMRVESLFPETQNLSGNPPDFSGLCRALEGIRQGESTMRQ
jgi:hypothetical protein